MDPAVVLELASHWSVLAFAVVFGTLAIDFVQRRLMVRLLVQAQTRTKNVWDDALVASIKSPLSLLIWVMGISLAAEIASENTKSALFDMVPAARILGVITAFAWFLMLIVRNAELAYLGMESEGEPVLDRATVSSIARLLRISLFITAVLAVLQNLGISISGLLAFGGVGGLALGLAAKDLLANFFGTLMIFLDRPFAVGDWIRSPDKNIEGVVEHISWRLTRIRTFDKRPLYVPNSTFSTISVENPSRMSHRRIYETVGVRYEDLAKMEAIVSAVKKMLNSHPEIASDQTLMVNFNSFAPSSLDFFVYAFTKTTQWTHFHEVKQDVLVKIGRIITEHGAEIAFPTSTLHLQGGVQMAASAPVDPANQGEQSEEE